MSDCFRIAAILLLSILLAACSNVQQPANMRPMTAKKNSPLANKQYQVVGSMKNGRYTSVIGDIPSNPTFSVKIPQANTFDAGDMQMKDQRGVNSTLVRFGPAAQDKNIYRLIVSTVPSSSISFDQLSRDMIKETMREMYRDVGIEPVLLHQAMLNRQNHQTLFSVFQQTTVNNNSATSTLDSLTQVVYIVDYGTTVAEFWITATDQGRRNAVTGRDRLTLIRQAWQPMLDFVNSFQLSRDSDTTVAGKS